MPSTLPGPGFVEAVNRNGEKQVIPAHYLAPGSPFAHQFRLPPSAVARRGRQSEEASASTSRPQGRTKRPQGQTHQAPPSGDDKKE